MFNHEVQSGICLRPIQFGLIVLFASEKMTWIIRALGFVVFAVATQYFARVSRIDVLEDITIFSLQGAPHSTLVMLSVASAIWLLLDGFARIACSVKKRQVVFWTLWVTLAVGAAVAPPFMSRDGLAVGLLWFIFGTGLITIALYGLIVWAVETIWRRKQIAKSGVKPVR